MWIRTLNPSTGGGGNVAVDVDRGSRDPPSADQLRPSPHSPTAGNAGTRVDGMHSHPEIVKEDAFLRLHTVSLTRGQVDPGFRFAKNKEPRLDFGIWKTAKSETKGRLLIRLEKRGFEALPLSLQLKRRTASRVHSNRRSRRIDSSTRGVRPPAPIPKTSFPARARTLAAAGPSSRSSSSLPKNEHQ